MHTEDQLNEITATLKEMTRPLDVLDRRLNLVLAVVAPVVGADVDGDAE